MATQIYMKLSRRDGRHIDWKVKGETDLERIVVSAKAGMGVNSMDFSEEAGTSVEKGGAILWSGSCKFEAEAIGKSKEGKEQKASVSGELDAAENFASESDKTPP